MEMARYTRSRLLQTIVMMFLLHGHTTLHAYIMGPFIVGSALTGSAAYAIHNARQKKKLSLAETKYKSRVPQALGETVNPEDAPVITLFSHGLGVNHKHGKFYHLLHFTTSKVHTFDYRDSSALANPEPSFLAQDGDIERLKEEYLKLSAQGYKIVLYGVSRGAATIINFLGSYKTKNVIATVIESPFPTVLSVINSVLSRKNLDVVVGFPSLANTLCSKFMYKNYDIYGINPIYVAHMIQKDIPIFMICSNGDKLIPALETLRLYDALKQAGHPKTHLLRTEHGTHGQIMDFETNQYLYDVHAFYNYYYKGMGNAQYSESSTHPDFKQ